MSQATPILGDPTRGTIGARVFPFATAKTYEMPIGKYRGQTLDRIATTDAGLLYLDWLLGQREYREQGIASSANERETTAMLRAYLTDPTIAKEVIEAKARDGRKGRG